MYETVLGKIRKGQVFKLIDAPSPTAPVNVWKALGKVDPGHRKIKLLCHHVGSDPDPVQLLSVNTKVWSMNMEEVKAHTRHKGWKG